MEILCVGLACWDLNFRVAHHPAPDEKVQAQSLLGTPGGPALNAARQIARLGGSPQFLGRLGNDAMGESVAAVLTAESVGTREIFWTQGTTPTAAIVIKPDGQRSVISANAAPPLPTTAAPPIQPASTAMILADGHQAPITQELFSRASALHIPTLLDAGSMRPGMEILVTSAAIVAASARFARQWYGSSDLSAAVLNLHESRQRKGLTLVTDGERGLHWIEGSGPAQFLPAFAVQTLNSNACGDAFHGALAWSFIHHPERHTGAHLTFAAAVGALVASQPTGVQRFPDLRAAEGFLDQRMPAK